MTRRSIRSSTLALGFSLIEIMVVVAMISILTTMALPRFFEYQARAVRAEAQSNLAAIRALLEAQYGEGGVYTDNLVTLGFGPTGRPRYIYGFTSDGAPSASGVNDTAELSSVRGGYSTDQMVNSAGLPLTEADLPAATVGVGTYTIGAAGELDKDADLDLWTLGKTTGIVHVASDL